MKDDPAALVADLGAQLESLGFDPDAEGQAPAAVAEYRRAVEAYEGAQGLLRRPSDGWRDGKIRRIVRAGRAAVDRMNGPHGPHGLAAPEGSRLAQPSSGGTPPTPRDARPTPTYRYTGEGRPAGKAVFAIDWPEPGRPAVARVVMRKAEWIAVRPRTDHGDEFRTGDTFIDTLGPLDRSALLMPGPTHLVVDSPAPGGWSVELLRLDQVPVVGPGALGKGASVLYHPGELPLDLTFEISSKYVWNLKFLPLSATAGNRLTTGPDGNGDSRRVLTVPARCLVVLTVIDQGEWSFGQRRPDQAAR